MSYNLLIQRIQKKGRDLGLYKSGTGLYKIWMDNEPMGAYFEIDEALKAFNDMAERIFR